MFCTIVKPFFFTLKIKNGFSGRCRHDISNESLKMHYYTIFFWILIALQFEIICFASARQERIKITTFAPDVIYTSCNEICTACARMYILIDDISNIWNSLQHSTLMIQWGFYRKNYYVFMYNYYVFTESEIKNLY